MRTELELVLEFFFLGLEALSRRDCGLILAGVHSCPSSRRIDALLRRLEEEQRLTRTGRGRRARFAITPQARPPPRASPAALWSRPWDGRWRVFCYDLPELRRRDRLLLWRALRAEKLGFLQRSLWIWPDDLETRLRQIVKAEGIPECFCGFRCDSVFLSSDAEVVKAAWDWKEIGRAHDAYRQAGASEASRTARAVDLGRLAEAVHDEQAAYRTAFHADPLLPRALWPPAYAGEAVERRHQAFLAAATRRARDLAEPQNIPNQ